MRLPSSTKWIEYESGRYMAGRCGFDHSARVLRACRTASLFRRMADAPSRTRILLRSNGPPTHPDINTARRGAASLFEWCACRRRVTRHRSSFSNAQILGAADVESDTTPQPCDPTRDSLLAELELPSAQSLHAVAYSRVSWWGFRCEEYQFSPRHHPPRGRDGKTEHRDQARQRRSLLRCRLRRWTQVFCVPKSEREPEGRADREHDARQSPVVREVP